jgi:lipoate-protein ligase A
MNSWQLIVSPKLPGQKNMETDLKLFNNFEQGSIPSTLRIYSWKPRCISVGYSQDLIRKDGWDVVKRPTGGGIVFHNETEVTYSLVTDLNNPILPEGMVPSYKKISEAIVHGLKALGIDAEITSNLKPQTSKQIPISKTQLCFSYPAEYEIVADGKKIVGSAQKRGKKALLQQGSICIEEYLGIRVKFDEVKNALIAGFSERLGIQFT